ncbi:MAG: UDP-N-acetylmuramate:L-alanyl-gamma-D-glutamyl-meso-diaminopimelate ligase [Gammaproteobacteria bacterium]|nr:MAG: UDP-N-acetylmuramate:L-alanyl-gamma-D-glutamyl-meso-diaminopimelate ligase [Gammaproteobacteria bacterium]
MHIHILGICGTFMGGLALLARELGHTVSGSDENVYPPMSTQLQEQGITLMQGYEAEHLKPEPDIVVIGNALSRGNLAVEAVLEQGLRYTSGAQWLLDFVLQDRWVLAVAGTHGKTSTASLLAWLLEDNKMSPGFLIGGIPGNFGVSARLGETSFFVVEADEYDTAFFDKRAKFVHYHPRTLILNNLEYDHADIFPDIAAIQTQFHHLLRTVPANGLVISHADDPYLDQTIAKGCWTPIEYFAGKQTKHWQKQPITEDGLEFDVLFNSKKVASARWSMLGQHNMNNALAAIAAARHVGVPAEHSVASLSGFKGIKRRMEVRGIVNNITVYDDFAHHPTAIQLTLDGLRNNVGKKRIFAILEPRSNTMKMGVHKDTLAQSLAIADCVYLYQAESLDWNLEKELNSDSIQVFSSTHAIIDKVLSEAKADDHIVIMSNGGFEGIHQRLLTSLMNKYN